jgi:ribosomal protein S18 acetylase RimI-like enzyme
MPDDHLMDIDPLAARAADAPLRVWLEPGYDHGRWGAWLLEWPGCFTWGSTREGAQGRCAAAAWRFAEWLERHAETRPPVPLGRPEIVEEVAPTSVDGYERNATFDHDRRAISEDELERSLRWIGFAHVDLVDAAQRVAAFEASGGSLRMETRDADAVAAGAEEGREARAVVRHVAGAETWLASRLDRTLRFDAVDPDDDLDAYVEQTNAWAIERLRELWRRDPALSSVDGKGESWTLAKVLRRQIYHLRDHTDELERRLALADGWLDRVRLVVDGDVPAPELIELGAAGGMYGMRRLGAERLVRALRGSVRTVAAFDGERLIGFARLVGDGVSLAYVSFVVIHPDWQDRGLGRRVMDALLADREEDKFILEARVGAEPFYERLGFETISWAMVRRRHSRS